MDSREKNLFTRIGNSNKKLVQILSKIVNGEEVSKKEVEFLLAIAYVFIEEFDKSNQKPYVDFAYFLILKYVFLTQNYRTLYDFSLNFGYYPIARKIIDLELLDSIKINDLITDYFIDDFKKDGIVQTEEQKKVREQILSNRGNNISYIAPTSYGKSEIIVEHIIRNIEYDKIGIIVPTKSLLNQTFRYIKSQIKDRRILIHDDMYLNEDRFIAVVTQERALRLMDKYNLFFDILYIDEAHNILGYDGKAGRNILLARLIKKNGYINYNQKVVYLSPLINDSNNLKIYNQTQILENRIYNNIKSLDIWEYKKNGSIVYHEVFLKKELATTKFENMFEYIMKVAREKNFHYHYRPIRIEEFSKELYDNLPVTEANIHIESLVAELEQLVHKEFKAIKYLKKGIIYLHGVLPDHIKEYLEYNFKNYSCFKHLVANTVVLEGMNFPIDCLFIYHSKKLKQKQLVNLIGRVNRLNEIFTLNNNLGKLLVPVHFVNSEKYNSNGNMKNIILQLRNDLIEDNVENPLLEKYDPTKDSPKEFKEKKIIIVEEEFLIEHESSEDDFKKFESLLIKSGIQALLEYNDEEKQIVFHRIKYLMEHTDYEYLSLNIVDKVYEVFFNGIEYNDEEKRGDYEVTRLKHNETRKFYINYIESKNSQSLKERVNRMLYYFKKINDNATNYEETYFYMGGSFGEIAKRTSAYQDSHYKVYVDLSKKNDYELTNYAVLKICMEDKFINFKFNKFAMLLYDLKLIDESEYNIYFYGTEDTDKIAMYKAGFSPLLVDRLDKDEQIQNIDVDLVGNFTCNEEFKEYISESEGYFKYELEKYF